jgi:ethanolamine ammonia-lyase large subunit
MSNKADSTSENAAKQATEEVTKVTPAPVISDLEAALAAYSAANPIDGRKLASHIVKLQKEYESTKRKASELEEHARVDKDVLRNQLQQLITHLSPDITKQYCIDNDNIDAQILSDKNGIAHNAVHRVIAACNATFMAKHTPVVAKVNTSTPEPSNKRTKIEESKPEPMNASEDPTDDDSALLRRALAAVYE